MVWRSRLRIPNVLDVTRNDIRAALDRLVGDTSMESVLRDLRHWMVRSRAEHPGARRAATPIRDLLGSWRHRGVTSNVLRELRTAAARSASRSR
ncbi:MAG TPA: hypothetical protein VLV78_22330 [Thermoanaerobaculia bacterium]|nr:hypothetical protein [Thermoanaerobaculia bacterium]